MIRRRNRDTDTQAPEAEPEVSPAHAALKAFEAKLFGDNAVYHNGKIEDGHGSLFSTLSDDNKAHHAALVALVAAFEEQQAAVAALEAANAKVKAAGEAAEATAAKVA